MARISADEEDELSLVVEILLLPLLGPKDMNNVDYSYACNGLEPIRFKKMVRFNVWGDLGYLGRQIGPFS